MRHQETDPTPMWLRAAIKKFGGQAALARAIGITRQSVFLWTTTECRPSWKTAWKIEHVTNGLVKAHTIRPDIKAAQDENPTMPR